MNRADSDDRARPTSVTVVETVARSNGVSPTELEESLADVLDPDALDGLFDERARDPLASALTVQFEFAGCTVVVDGSGTLVRAEAPTGSSG